MDEIDIARAEQRERADILCEKFYTRHRQDICRWSLERDDERFLRTLTTGALCDRPLLSNSIVRQLAAYAWIDALLADFEQYPDRDRLFITLAWDAPVTWERQPEIDTVSLRNIATQHLRRSQLDGVGVLEIDTWKEIPGEPGKRMTPHIHFLGHSRNGEKIDAKALAASMCSRGALLNSLGAPSADVQEVGKTAKDLATLGCYMSKPPAFAKNPVPQRLWSGYKLSDVEHAPGSVTRLIEVLSYLELGDVMFAIGEGKHISRQVRESVRAKLARSRRAVPAPTREMIRRHWLRIRLNNGNKKFDECNVITRAHQRANPEAEI